MYALACMALVWWLTLDCGRKCVGFMPICINIYISMLQLVLLLWKQSLAGKHNGLLRDRDSLKCYAS